MLRPKLIHISERGKVPYVEFNGKYVMEIFRIYDIVVCVIVIYTIVSKYATVFAK